MVDTIIREAKEMKEIYYPRYVNEYRRLDETIIRLDRRCADGKKDLSLIWSMVLKKIVIGHGKKSAEPRIQN